MHNPDHPLLGRAIDHRQRHLVALHEQLERPIQAVVGAKWGRFSTTFATPIPFRFRARCKPAKHQRRVVPTWWPMVSAAWCRNAWSAEGQLRYIWFIA